MVDITADVTRLLEPGEPLFCDEMLATINAERIAGGHAPTVVQDVYRAVAALFEVDRVSFSDGRWVWRGDVPVSEDTEGMLFQ